MFYDGCMDNAGEGHIISSINLALESVNILPGQMCAFACGAYVFQINKLKSTGPFTPAVCGAHGEYLL